MTWEKKDSNIFITSDFNNIGDLYEIFGKDTSIFYVLATSWGRLRFSDEVETAAVRFCKGGGRPVEILFNKNFYKKLTGEQRKFVISHECLHIILQHGTRMMGLDKNTCNIAMDVVINEMLVRHYGYDKRSALNLNAHFIENTFDEDELILPDMSFEYYYSKLMERQRNYSEMDNHESLFDIAGTYVESRIDEMINSLNTHKVDKIARLAGDGNLQEKVRLKIKKSMSKKLAKLITKFKRKAINENRSEQWVFKDRRLTNIDMLIPQDGENVSICKSKVNVAFFADCSGSCIQYAESFYNTLFSMPTTHVNCNYYLFDTQCTKIKRGDEMIYGGGTSFSIIEAELTKKKIYPDLVFVITDGDGNFVYPKYPNRWHVFLTKEGNGKMFEGVKHLYNYSDLDSKHINKPF